MLTRSRYRYWLLLLVMGFVLAACESLGNEFLGMPLTQATPEPTVTPNPTPDVMTPVVEPTESPETSEEGEIITLQVWIPPLMDPANGTPAGELLQAQLDDFVADHPEVEIIVRLKAETGPASLLQSLTAVSAVAPLELPSLVVLSRNDLESAAKKGLILPMGGYSTVINEIDWFQYARSLTVIADSSYGLPLVGDALVMVVREQPAGDDTETMTPQEEALPVAFWRNDPDAALLLTHYLALGGQLFDDENQIMLEEEILVEVYALIQAQQTEGLLSAASAEISSYAALWQSFLDGTVDRVIIPSSFPLRGLPDDTRVVALTSLTDYDFTLARGWTVALADPLPERRELAVALAEALTEVDFMGKWSEALGYLPVREAAFDEWYIRGMAQRLSMISVSARSFPSQEVIPVVAPALQAGLAAVLDQGLSAEEAAKIAVDSLNLEE